jgi:hypothetical protein
MNQTFVIVANKVLAIAIAIDLCVSDLDLSAKSNAKLCEVSKKLTAIFLDKTFPAGLALAPFELFLVNFFVYFFGSFNGNCI